MSALWISAFCCVNSYNNRPFTSFNYLILYPKERKWPPPLPKRPAKGRGGVTRERSLDLQDRQRQEARRRLMAAKRAASFRQNSATERADSIEIYIPEAQTRLWGPRIHPLSSLLSTSTQHQLVASHSASSLLSSSVIRSSTVSSSVAILWVVPVEATLGKLLIQNAPFYYQHHWQCGIAIGTNTPILPERDVTSAEFQSDKFSPTENNKQNILNKT